MRTKHLLNLQTTNINETLLIKFKNILKKNSRKTNIQIKIYFKCLFTSIF